MFARGLKTGNALKTFLLVGALVFSPVLHAEDVGLHFVGTNYGGTGTTASAFQFTVNAPSATFPTNGATVWTYCISPTTYLNYNDKYKLRDDIQNLPQPPGPPGMGLVAAAKIEIIINEFYGTGFGNNALAFPTYNYLDLQNAIWWYVSGAGANNAIVAAVDAIFAASSNSLTTYYSNFGGGGIVYIHGLDAYGLENGVPGNAGQDQIWWSTTPNHLIEGPVPAGAILAGLGIACVGGFNFIRRRKVSAA